MSIREPDGSVEKALVGRTIVGVGDTKDEISFTLDNGDVVSIRHMLLPGVSGHFHEAVLSVNGNILAAR